MLVKNSDARPCPGVCRWQEIAFAICRPSSNEINFFWQSSFFFKKRCFCDFIVRVSRLCNQLKKLTSPYVHSNVCSCDCSARRETIFSLVCSFFHSNFPDREFLLRSLYLNFQLKRISWSFLVACELLIMFDFTLKRGKKRDTLPNFRI